MRVVFMGTPHFAVASLEAINKDFNVVAVVTAPDRKKGRGQKVVPSPVKEFAVEHEIPVLQPANLKNEDFIKQLRSFNADLQVVVAFRMLPDVVWNMPPMGSLNLHASLLPQYRGAAPINHAIINGETVTGVTTFFLQHDIDTGNIIMQEKVEILPEDNAGTLHDKLMDIGAMVVAQTLKRIEDGNLDAIPQETLSEDKLKSAPKIFKENCKINWLKQGQDIHNLVRGLSPYPAAWATFARNGKEFTTKIFEADFIKKEMNKDPYEVFTDQGRLFVSLPDGVFEIKDIQPQSKKRITGIEFVRGLQKNDRLTLVTD